MNTGFEAELKKAVLLGTFCATLLAILHTNYVPIANIADVCVLYLWFFALYTPIVTCAITVPILLLRPIRNKIANKYNPTRADRCILTIILSGLLSAFLFVSVAYKLPFEKVDFVESYPGMQLFVLGLAIVLGIVALLVAWATTRFLEVASPNNSWPRIAIALSLCCAIAITNRAVSKTQYAENDNQGATPIAPAPTPSKNKVIELGFDGATWTVLQPLIDAGALPNFARLVKEGAHGPLETLPDANSAVIWNTIHTGMQREKHGILDFYNVTLPGMRTAIYPIHRTSFRELLMLMNRVGLVEMTTTNATMAQVRPVWDIVSDAGYQVGVLGGYMTWPADQGIAGFVIAENAYERFQRNQEHESYLAPTALQEDFKAIAAQHPKLSTELAWKDAFLLDYLATNPQPNYLQIFIHEPDMVQHKEWSWIEPQFFPSNKVANRDPKDNPIHATYKKMDAFLGRLLNAIDPNTNILIISDHGIGTTFWGGKNAAGEPIEGAHRWGPPGIAILHGPDFKPDHKLSNISVFDITPTILALLGLPIAKDMDGRPHEEAFTETFRETQNTRTIPTYGPVKRGDEVQKPSASPDTTEVIDQLETLGYL